LAIGSLPCAKECLQETSQSQKQWTSMPLFQFLVSLVSYLDNSPSEWHAFIKQNSSIVGKYSFLTPYLNLISSQFFKNQGSFGFFGDFMKNLMSPDSQGQSQMNNNPLLAFDLPVDEDVD
jgi:hypothetical protein